MSTAQHGQASSAQTCKLELVSRRDLNDMFESVYVYCGV